MNKKLGKFSDSLPKLESHYCRNDSLKSYLEPTWTAKSQLCKAFVFEELNLSLFRPKKDLCDVYESYKSGNVTEYDNGTHQNTKEKTRKALIVDTASEHVFLLWFCSLYF